MGRARDFFVSYTGADLPWARWIAWELEAAGYTTILQDWNFQAGANFILEMHRAAKETERTIAVLSPGYLEALYTQPEWAAALVRDPTGSGRQLVPVRIEDCKPEGLLASVIYIDLVGLDEATARERLRERIAGTLRGSSKPRVPPPAPMRQGKAATGRPRFATALPPVWNVPYRRNPTFTGREEVLAALARQLGQGAAAAVTQAIQGAGGIGKTAVATEYAWRHRADFEVVWWVQAEEPTTLVGDLADLAAALNLPAAAQADQQLAVGAARRWLEDHDRWLLVLDNAQGPQTATGLEAPLERLADVLPRVIHGQVLVTSRDVSWDSQAMLIELDLLSPEEAIQFLLRRTDSGDQQAAAEVTERLGYLALALEQAGAYVRESRISLADYLHRLRRFPERMLAKGRPRHHDPTDTVATTWQVSLERVRKVPGAVALLEACAFLAPDDIPRGLFTEQVARQPEELAALAADMFALDAAVAELRRYSLVTATPDTLTVHRLVQTVVRDSLSDQERRHWVGAATQLVTAAFPHGSDDVETWPTCALLLPHALAVVDYAQQYDVEPEATALLLNEAGFYLWSRGQYRQAQDLQEQALAVRRRVLGDDHPDSLVSMYDLAETHRALGHLQDARKLHETTLTARRQVLDEGNRDILQSMNSLAVTRRQLGDLQGAHQLFEQTLTDRRRVLGRDHPDTLNSMNSLAETRRNLGNLKGARQLFQRTLAARRRVLGHNHPETLWTMNNLAETRRGLGDLRGARKLHEQTLAGYRKVLGDDHPTTLTARNSHAVTRQALGDLRGAHDLHEQILSTRRRVLGDDHPDTLWSMSNLAEIRRGLGDLRGARQLHQQTLAARRRVLGDDHPNTLISMSNLAETRRGLGDLRGARRLHQQALATRRRVLGDDHPNTLWSMNSLAETRRNLGDLVGARELFQQTYAARLRVLGDDHPDTLWSMHGLAMTRRNLGDLKGARELFEQTLATRLRVLGDDHPDTLQSMHSLAAIRRDLGDLKGARELFEQTLATRLRVLGDEHPDTLWTMHGLAETHRNSGDLQAAHELHVQILAIRRRVLGDHPDTLRSMNSVAMTRRALGNLEGARELFEETLEARGRALGDDHPETLWTMHGLAETCRDLGDLQRACELHYQTLVTRRKVLGDHHPDTRASMNKLAEVEVQL